MRELDKFYQVIPPAIWTGRHDAKAKEYYFQHFNTIDVSTQAIPKATFKTAGLIGFCCDEGVKRNYGRVGAHDGPNAIRKYLARLAYSSQNHYDLYDFGNISCYKDQLTQSQLAFANLSQQLIENNILSIGLGGGHEIAWAHFLGIVDAFPKKDIAIINLDAHLDMRPDIHQQTHSGSSFRQIAQYCEQFNMPFNYLCVGLQPLANSESMYSLAEKNHVKMIHADQIMRKEVDVNQQITKYLQQHEIVYVTLCMDVLNIANAPGVSAPQVFGLYPEHILPALNTLAQSGKVVAFDIAELAPSLDEQDKTAKLAANFLAEFISHYNNKLDK